QQKYGTTSWAWISSDKTRTVGKRSVDVIPEIISDIDELGGIPIVRFDNFHCLGEFEPHIDLLDRIIDDVLQRIVGFWYQALRKQAGMGGEEEGDLGDQDSVVQDPNHKPKNRIDWDNLAVQAGPGALLKFPKDFT